MSNSQLIIKIEVDDTYVDHKSGDSAKTGKPYEINTQEVWAYMPGQRHPEKVKVQVPSKNQPYPKGDYNADLAPCIVVGGFKEFAFDNRRLVLQAVAAKAAG